VTVRAETEMDEVEPCARGDDRLVDLGGLLTVHRDKARGRHDAPYERLFYHALVGVRVLGRDAALVAYEALDSGPVKLSLRGQALVAFARGRAPREDETEGLRPTRRRLEADLGGDKLSEGLRDVLDDA